MTPSRRQWLPEDVVALARSQHWVVSLAGLLARGITYETIKHAVASGRLHRVHDGVFAVGRPDLTREGRWMAAVLAVGDEAAVSHRPAGLLWQLLTRADERPHVTIQGATHRTGPPGVVVHRALELEVDRRLRIPVTSLIQTITDLAGDLGQPQLKAVIREGLRRHPLDLGALRTHVEHPRTDHRRARVRKVLDLWVPNVHLAQSEFEARFYELVAAAGLDLPELQRPFGPYRSDFVWEDCELVVETDGRDHDTPAARQEDAARDRALFAAGYVVLRYRWADVVNRPALVRREVRDAIARLRRARAIGA
jgi:very-short-patch-repair endonuclease